MDCGVVKLLIKRTEGKNITALPDLLKSTVFSHARGGSGELKAIIILVYEILVPNN